MAKLCGARERKRAKAESTTLDGRGKCEGRKSVAELRLEMIEAAAKLNDGRSPRSGRFRDLNQLGEGGSKSRALTHHDAKGRRLLWAE